MTATEEKVFHGHGLLHKSEASKWVPAGSKGMGVSVYWTPSLDHFRIIARDKDNTIHANFWVTGEATVKRLNATFVHVRASKVNYGFLFTDPSLSEEFFSTIEDAILIHAVFSKKKKGQRMTMMVANKQPDIDLDADYKKYRAKYKNIRDEIKKKEEKKKTDKEPKQLSFGQISGLKNVAQSFHEEMLQFISKTNEIMLNPASLASSLQFGPFLDKFQIILVLTQGVTNNHLIYEYSKEMMDFCAYVPKSGTLNPEIVGSVTPQNILLMLASLVKIVVNKLAAMKNLAVQIEAITLFLAGQNNDFTTHFCLFGAVRAFGVAAVEAMNAVATYKAVESKEHISSSQSHGQKETSANSQTPDIWEETVEVENLPENKEAIAIGTFNQLVNKLFSLNYDTSFNKIFFQTHQSFATPQELFEKFQQKFRVPSSIDEKAKNQLQIKVGIQLKYWVESQIDDFDNNLLQELKGFIEKEFSQDSLKTLQNALIKYLNQKVSEREQRTMLWFSPPARVLLPEEGICLADMLLEVSPMDIAQQLTLIDSEYFSAIQLTELLDQAWNKPKLKHRAPNVLAMITRSTQLSGWVALMILSQQSVSFRARMIQKFMDTVKALVDLKNFNTVMGIMGGLGLTPVYRLSEAKGKISKNCFKDYQKIEQLMSPQGSFKAYRAALENSTPPTLPYLGTHLTDLTFIDEGNPSMINDKINFKKRLLTTQKITKLLNCLSKPYTFAPVEPLHTLLSQLPFLDEEGLFRISNTLEKRK